MFPFGFSELRVRAISENDGVLKISKTSLSIILGFTITIGSGRFLCRFFLLYRFFFLLCGVFILWTLPFAAAVTKRRE
ncbi:hypothetical protein Glove_688g18 [Diversispora epigaea]|uniref:Uncharacterized protein n=1 Tax=Diversispora epigaea TaxID=1348612 RepID=A0A397G8C2_9GLOM|nr:hypothetical protein Glove_688g18 [Diversispora epigaea]